MANDIQDWEREAVLYGGSMGGEYLESIKVFDLAKLTPSQWETFCEVVCMNYHAKRVELQPAPF